MKYCKRDIRFFRTLNFLFAAISLTIALGWSREVGFPLFALSLYFLFRPFHADEKDDSNEPGTPPPMKLKKLNLVEIRYDSEFYTYAVSATSFFKKHSFAFVFRSTVPHFWWSEIQKEMVKLGLMFEKLQKGKKEKINIGTLEYRDFSKEELSKYGKNPAEWKDFLEVAIRKQKELEEEYSDKYESPDLNKEVMDTRFSRTRN